jgi:hypothetical protein
MHSSHPIFLFAQHVHPAALNRVGGDTLAEASEELSADVAATFQDEMRVSIA